MKSKLLVLILLIGIVYAVTNDDWGTINVNGPVMSFAANFAENIYTGGF